MLQENTPTLVQSNWALLFFEKYPAGPLPFACLACSLCFFLSFLFSCFSLMRHHSFTNFLSILFVFFVTNNSLDHCLNEFCGNDDNKLFFQNDWRTKYIEPYFQLDHYVRDTPLQISNVPQAGFEPVQKLSSGFVKWSCVVALNNTPHHHKDLAVVWLVETFNLEIIKCSIRWKSIYLGYKTNKTHSCQQFLQTRNCRTFVQTNISILSNNVAH